MYLLIPKGTNLHEIIRLPKYNYNAKTAKRNDMLMEKYSFGSHYRQYLVLFLPKHREVTQKEVILYFHGGGWTFGNPMMFRCNAQFFVDLGYVVVMPTYRRLPFYRAPDMHKDTILALKKTMTILKSKGLGDKKIIIAGLSSGAHLAALLAFNHTNHLDFDFPKERLAGVMLFGAPLDLSKMAMTPVLWRLAGNHNRDLFQKSNPVIFLTKSESTPVLLIHGTKDGLVNYKSALSFAEKYRAKLLTFHTIENGTHLDAGNWIFEEGKVRNVVLKWLKHVEG